MAATVQQIPSARPATCLSSGVSLPTSSGDDLVNTGGQHQRKSAKTKRNELKLVFGEYRDRKKEEKMVKELLKEGSEIAENVTLSSSVTTVGSTSTETQEVCDAAAVRSDAHHQLVNRKHQLHRAEGERRTRCVPKSYLRREAVIGAWQDEQSKVNRPILRLYCMWPLFYLTTVGLNFLSARLSH